VLVGILSAVMILSQPYAILMFLVWAVAVFAALPFSKNKNIHPLLKFRNFFFVGVGAFAVLVVFIAVVLSRAGISEVRNGFHYLMNDPEHQMDLKYKVSKYFERFYRSSEVRTNKIEGNGIGLSIASEIVEVHNGTIKAYGRCGKTG
jgi:hypothetical protein